MTNLLKKENHTKRLKLRGTNIIIRTSCVKEETNLLYVDIYENYNTTCSEQNAIKCVFDG